ncbi:hypothetical protein Peur_022844 [Populus x canadensis]
MDFFSNCDASIGLIYGMCYLMMWTVFCISSNDEWEVISMLVLLQQVSFALFLRFCSFKVVEPSILQAGQSSKLLGIE